MCKTGKKLNSNLNLFSNKIRLYKICKTLKKFATESYYSFVIDIEYLKNM